MSKCKAIKIIALPYLLSSFSFKVVFYVQHVHKSCPFFFLKFMVFNSIGNKVVLTYITQRFFFYQAINFSRALCPVAITFIQWVDFSS